MKNFTEAAYTHWPLIADHILQATFLLGAILILAHLLKRLSSARKHALLLMGLLGIPDSCYWLPRCHRVSGNCQAAGRIPRLIPWLQKAIRHSLRSLCG
jgi:hypothetical protein